jgi:hypothetical protein
MKTLFTQRFGLSEPRVKEALDPDLKRGLLTVVNSKIDENLFAQAFSEECPDVGNHGIGCDLDKLKVGLAAFRVIWPRGWPEENDHWPSDPQLFDLIEFLYEHSGLPKAYGYHSFFGHSHLDYDQEAGRAKFEQTSNGG